MKPKIKNKYFKAGYPYQIFSLDNVSSIKDIHRDNIPKSTKYRNKQDLNHQVRPMTTITTRTPSEISSIAKSLKSVALSSQLYGDYINFYSDLTQEHTFKTPKVNKYPILKNEKFLPITLRPSTAKETNKEIITLTSNIENSLFLSNMKETKPTKKVIEEKPYGFKYGTTRIRFDRAKSANTYIAAKDFGELVENNLFESKFLKQIGLKKIDMYNSTEEKNKNFKFFNDYMKKSTELKDIFNEANFYRNISFNGKTAIKKHNMEYKIEIYSLCLKFFPLNDNNTNNTNNKKECQKLYFPFELMPIFYLLDLTSFKVLLSEIIKYDEKNKCFHYIKEYLLLKKIKKYYNYISYTLENRPKFINNITYNKNEINFGLIYDWIVSKNINNEENGKNIKEKNNKNYSLFKLKIVLPKIKFSIINLKMKIIKFLHKHMLANLLQNKFIKWQKFIFSELFSTKKFRIITNLIMLNKYYNFQEKKIHLNKVYKVKNKVYEFFLTFTDENNSHYYTFIPYIILILFGIKDKNYQKINLTLKESKNINKFGKYWGVINTLFKCMFIDKMKNKISFKLNSLEDNKNELYKVVVEENYKQNMKELNLNNLSIDGSINNMSSSNSIKKNTVKYNTIKEREKDDIITKYKDNIYEISLLNCTLLEINITSIKSEFKYYRIPSNILKTIFSIKDENKIFNTNCAHTTLIGKSIGENSKFFLSMKEASIITEEQAFLKKGKIKDEVYKFQKSDPPQRHQYNFNRLKTFQLLQNTEKIIKKDFVSKELKNNLNFEGNKAVINQQHHIVLSGGNPKTKKVSVTNINELQKIRIEHRTREDKRWTTNRPKFK